MSEHPTKLSDGRLLDLGAGNVAVSAANLHPAGPGTAPGRAPEQLASCMCCCCMACRVFAWAAWQREEEIPVLQECVSERANPPCLGNRCPRQQLSSAAAFQASFPPARPTASLLHAVSQPVFSGARTSFFGTADGVMLGIGKRKEEKNNQKKGSRVCIYGFIDRGGTTVQVTPAAHSLPCPYVSPLFRHQILGSSS